MNLLISQVVRRISLPFQGACCRFVRTWLAAICLGLMTIKLIAAEPDSRPAGFSSTPFNITGYVVNGSSLLSTNVVDPLLAKYTGPDVTLEQVVQAAADLHFEFCKVGASSMSVAISRERLTNGVVTLNVFRTDIPQVVVSGECFLRFTNQPATGPASPAEMAQARAALAQTLDELKQREADEIARKADTRVHVANTNTGPRFAVDKYLVSGNTVLTPRAIGTVLTNIDGAYGTNVSFDGIRTVVSELQKAYRDRGFVTVAVGLPQQKLTNATVKVQVAEGRLATIGVSGNRYFSSNNVMRSLPSLHTNMVLNGPVFQAELNRANANRDRQIYPVIGPGPEPGSSALTLKVKDQLPLHGKVEFNNESSPGTPAFRVNTSAVYDNLWQRENSLGVQYGFSPDEYKQGNQWNFYDLPLIANYSVFYRLPLGSQEPIEDVIAHSPGNFGYNEATRQFNLPPSTGRPELTFFGSRSTTDTGVQTLLNETIFSTTNRSLSRLDVQQDTTTSQDLGFRLSDPLPEFSGIRSSLSGGLDYKTYATSGAKTNSFIFRETRYNAQGIPIATNVNTVSSPVPITDSSLYYLPWAVNYSGAWRGSLTDVSFGLGVSGNTWYDSSTTTNAVTASTGRKSLQTLTGSKDSTGYWVALHPNLSVDFNLPRQWVFSANAAGQWASEPLISNEQFGIGGVNSVRGYHEGEAFGDTGWYMSLEQKTPAHVVGMINGNLPLTLRGSLYMDYGAAYLLDPQGRPDVTQLWGTGFGVTAAAGSHWQARFLFSLPLIGTSSTRLDQPYFNFALTSQF